MTTASSKLPQLSICILLSAFILASCSKPPAPAAPPAGSPTAAAPVPLAKLPATAWKVTPELDSAAVEPASAKFPLSIDAASEVTFSHAWPPLALVVKRGLPARAEVINLHSGASLGVVQSPEMLPSLLVISPDGGQMAGRVLKPGPDHIRVWSFKTGRVESDHVLREEDQRQNGPVSILHFASADRLLALRTGGKSPHVSIMEKGQPVRNFTIASPQPHTTIIDRAVGTSHGGKYLLALVGNALVASDLNSGESAGAVELPADTANSFMQCKELVFSPEGKHMATLLIGQDRQSVRLLEVEVAGGKVTQNVVWKSGELLKSTSEYSIQQDEHPLAWLPDGSGVVLLGRLVWARNNSPPQLAFAEANDSKPRAVLSTDAVVAIVRGEKGTQSLQTVPRAGVTVAANDPPGQSAPPTSEAQWTAAVDAAPLTPQFSGETSAYFGLVPQPPRFPQRPGRYGACAVGDEYLVFDLESGRETKRFSANGATRSIFDVSPDGRFLVTANWPNAGEKWRFDVWNITRGTLAFTGEALAGVDENTLEFIGPAQLLISTGEQDTHRRRYAVWDVDRQQSVRQFVSPEGLGLYQQNSHVVTPGGRYALAVFQDTLLVHDLTTGKPLGKAKLPLATGRIMPQEIGAAVVSADGKSLYLLVRYHDQSGQVTTCDLASGELEQRAIDMQQLLAAKEENLAIRQVPWLMEDCRWLSYRQFFVNAQSGKIVGPLNIDRDATVWPLANDRFALGQIQLASASTPAVVVTSLPIAAHATDKLAAGVEALRPKVVAVVPPKTIPTKPTADPDKPDPSSTATKNEESPKLKWNPVLDPRENPEPLVLARQFSVSVGRNPRFFSSTPRGNTFVIVADDNKESAEVVNLATGKPASKSFPFNRRAEVAAIDPTGKYVAHQGSEENEVVIRDVETGHATTVKREGSFVYCRFLGFASNDRLVAAFTVDDRVEIKVWNVAGGKPVTEWVLPDMADDWAVRNTGFALSPGGRYLAALRYAGLVVYDLDNPESEQSEQFTVLPFSDKPDAHQHTFMKVKGIQFSPDGKRLAAEYSQLQQNYVTIWDMESGEPIVYRPTAQPLTLRTITHSERSPPLTWLPSGESLIVEGTIMLDAATACPYWVLAQDQLDSIFPLTANAMLAIDTSDEARLVSAPLPKPIFDAQKVARTSPFEALPPLTSAASSKPRAIDAKVAKLAPLPPDVQASKAATRTTALHGAAENAPARLAATGAVLAVERTIDHGNSIPQVIVAGPLPPDRAVVLETYDLASGKRMHNLQVPERTHLLDISPDGSLLLTGANLFGSGGYDRLDVWSPKLGRHAAGWQPVAAAAEFGDVPTWAGFIDKKHVLVHSKAGLVCWQLPECKPIYAVQTNSRPAFSPGRKYFIDGMNHVVRDSLTGQALLNLEGFSLGTWQGLFASAFTTDGAAIVGIASGGTSHSVVRWNLADGKVAQEFAIPPVQFERMALLGERGVLLLKQHDSASHGVTVVDLEQQQVVGNYNENGVHAPGVSDDYWRSDVAIVGGKAAYYVQPFAGRDFPWPALAPVPSYAVVGPGSKVAVDVQSNLPEAAKLRALLEAAVKTAGFTIDAGSSTRAMLEMKQEDRLLRKGPPRDITIPIVVCRIAILDQTGKVAWQMTDQRAREKPADFDPLAWVKERALPKRLFRPDWETQVLKGDLPKVSP